MSREPHGPRTKTPIDVARTLCPRGKASKQVYGPFGPQGKAPKHVYRSVCPRGKAPKAPYEPDGPRGKAPSDVARVVWPAGKSTQSLQKDRLARGERHLNRCEDPFARGPLTFRIGPKPVVSGPGPPQYVNGWHCPRARPFIDRFQGLCPRAKPLEHNAGWLCPRATRS